MTQATRTAPAHVWKFYRIGGLDQVAIDTGADLLHLRELDPKLWVALSCPVKGLEIDEKTLTLIDTDGDGRIRVPELLEAVDWATSYFKNAGVLLEGTDFIELSAIDDSNADGKALVAAMRQLLLSLGKPEAGRVGLGDLEAFEKSLSNGNFNGDGIVTLGSASDPALASVVVDAMVCLGPEMDMGGEAGIDAAKAEEFFAQIDAHAAWLAQGEASGISFLGDKMADAAQAFVAVRPKVDDFFARCLLADYDHNAAQSLNRSQADYARLAGKDLGRSVSECIDFPLAHIKPGASLPLLHGANPAWAGALRTLYSDLVSLVYGPEKTSLTNEEWDALGIKLEPYLEWVAEKKGALVEDLGPARVREIAASDAKARIDELIRRESAVSADFSALPDLEQLLRYHRDLRRLLRNFVNFFDFYSYDQKAIFQAGTLYLDSRSCQLCVRVENPATHSVLAAMSKSYVAYLECKRQGATPIYVAACFTQGDSDYLFEGRNGVFYDNTGADWDAKIIKVIDNSISIGQAFWSPYKRVIRFVEDQVAKRAAAAEADTDARLQSTATAAAVGAPVAATKAAPAAPRGSKFDVGTVAALGVAVGGITAALGAVLQAFYGLGIWMPLGLVGLVLLISGPSMIIAGLKLHQRNLGPLLEASGWAINGRVRINIPFGSALTKKAVLPPFAKRSLKDPYEDKTGRKSRIWTYSIVLLLLLAALLFAKIEKTWPFSEESVAPAKAALSAPAKAAAP